MNARFIMALLLLLLLLLLPAVSRADLPVKAAYFYSYMGLDHLDSLAAAGFKQAVGKNIADSLTARAYTEYRRYIDYGTPRGLEIIPAWSLQAVSRMWRLNPDRRYTWGTGKVEANVGCPVDSLFWRTTLYERADEILSALPEVRWIHLDLEIYTGSRTHYNVGPCRCGPCLAEFVRDRGAAGVDDAAQLGAYQEDRIAAIVAALLGELDTRHPGTTLSFFDLDLDFAVHRGVTRALAASGFRTANFTERTYDIAGAGVAPARQAVERLGLNAPLIAGLYLRRFTPAQLPEAVQSVLDRADGCFIFTTYMLWIDQARLVGTYSLPGPQAAYWDALRDAFTEVVPPPPPPPTDLPFPATVVLDNFDRANGPLGGAWTGTIAGAGLRSGRVKPVSGDYVAAVLGTEPLAANQEAYTMFVDVSRWSARHGLLLKVQGTSVESGAIEVRYDYLTKMLWVATYTPGAGWVDRGSVPGKISDDDVLGARALSDGRVVVYKNGAHLGEVSVAAWPFAGAGGRIGFTLENATSTRFDDFGGGSLAGGTAPPPTNRAPLANAGGSPTSGEAPLPVAFSSSGSADPDGDPLSYHWDFGDGQTSSEAHPARTFATGSFMVTLTVTDPHGALARDSLLVESSPPSTPPPPPVDDQVFPATPVLDGFERPTGPLGGSWTGNTAGAGVKDGRMKPVSGSYVTAFFGSAVLAANQEAYTTFVDVSRWDARQGLLLKVQGSSIESGAIEVRYDYVTKTLPVSTYTPGQGWLVRGSVTGRISDDDVLGARALSDGRVIVYKNGERLGEVSVAGWAFAGAGGRIGFTLENATSTRFDDFGGGSLIEPIAAAYPGTNALGEDPSARRAAIPRTVELTGAMPNPFRYDANIRFGLPTARNVQLAIYDLQGRRVATLADRVLPAGWHALRWDGRDVHGAPLAAGVYLVRLDSDAARHVRKVVLAP